MHALRNMLLNPRCSDAEVFSGLLSKENVPTSLITISDIVITEEGLTVADEVISSRVNIEEKVLFRTCAHSSSGIASPATFERVISGCLQGFTEEENFLELLVDIGGRSWVKKFID